MMDYFARRNAENNNTAPCARAKSLPATRYEGKTFDLEARPVMFLRVAAERTYCRHTGRENPEWFEVLYDDRSVIVAREGFEGL